MAFGKILPSPKTRMRSRYRIIIYGKGISKVGEIVDIGVQLDIIDKAGAWFTVDGERIQGREGVKEYLLNNPDICDKIEQQIRDNQSKLMESRHATAEARQNRTAASAVDISADDFNG